MSDARTININARISPALHAAVQGLAENERRKVATMIALLLEEAVVRRLAARFQPANSEPSDAR